MTKGGDTARPSSNQASGHGGARLVAVLGPTNTGKTHLALERMLERRSGMIGFPLRLLARENYDRVVAARGEGGVAVVFGALSPRTRNAQVGLYQGGEVDYLVATDAIGMGLNLDIDHVTFT